MKNSFPSGRYTDRAREATARPSAGSVMDRMTVEDCLEVVDNRFELVMMAAKRARQRDNGGEAQIDNAENDDKPTVLALREIAADGESGVEGKSGTVR